jgi:hypothetical protein
MLDGPNVSVFKIDETQLVNDLPPKVYAVRHNPLTGFYLAVEKDHLETPAKIYGNTVDRAHKCIKTYLERPQSTGILMTGDKGTGKTLLMSILANMAIDTLNLPVLVVKEGYVGVEFTSFIESIGECVLVFDEFGKMYAADSRHNEKKPPQSALLSMMDGIDKTKRMFIFTENSQLDVSEFMLNRPSRVYYHFKYKKLDEASIMGYCKDKNVDIAVTKDIIDLARRLRIFSFDMLQSIVEEHLRFDCSIAEVKTELNIDTTEDRGALMEIIKVVNRSTNDECEIVGTRKVTKPASPYGYTEIKIKSEVGVPGSMQAASLSSAAPAEYDDEVAENDDGTTEIYFEDKHLAYTDGSKLVYETKEYIIVAKDTQIVTTDYWKLF